MLDLKIWLQDQGLDVRDLALELEIPLKTAQDWVYRGVSPSAENQARLTDYIFASCAHHWQIAAADGPTSEGGCRRCGQQKQFMNSGEPRSPWTRGKKQPE